MAKSKYTPETVEAIIDALREHGGDRYGWEAGAINKDTFYTWLKQHPDFSDRVARAKEECRENRPEIQRRQARRAFADYLFGRVVEKWISEETFDDGETVTRKVTTKTIVRGVPPWAIERVLGKQLDVLEVLKMLAEYKLLDEDKIDRAEQHIEAAKENIKVEIGRSPTT